MIKVLFVCLGNICRSPMAEGVLRKLVADADLAGRVQVASAGTGGWHIGDPPDRRAQAAAKKRGVDIARQRARQVEAADFERFDYVLAMDAANYEDLLDIAPGAESRVYLFLDFAPALGRGDVPDPYYGGDQGFEAALDMIEAAARGFLAHLKSNHL